MRTKLSLLCFEIREINLKVYFPVPSKITMMFSLVRTTAFCILRPLSLVCEGSTTLFPAVFVLRYTQVYVSTIYSSNIKANVEQPVNETFNISPTLYISDIYPDNCYI